MPVESWINANSYLWIYVDTLYRHTCGYTYSIAYLRPHSGVWPFNQVSSACKRTHILEWTPTGTWIDAQRVWRCNGSFRDFKSNVPVSALQVFEEVVVFISTRYPFPSASCMTSKLSSCHCFCLALCRINVKQVLAWYQSCQVSFTY